MSTITDYRRNLLLTFKGDAAARLEFCKEHLVVDWFEDEAFSDEYFWLMEAINNDEIHNYEGLFSKTVNEMWMLLNTYILLDEEDHQKWKDCRPDKVCPIALAEQLTNPYVIVEGEKVCAKEFSKQLANMKINLSN